MTLPTQLLTDAAGPAEAAGHYRAKRDSDGGASRKDDRDFASVMSDRSRETQARDTARNGRAATDTQGRDATREAPERTADGSEPADAPRDGTSAEDTPEAAAEAAAAETPRRQVTIPELPARRNAATPPEAPAQDAARATAATPDLADPEALGADGKAASDRSATGTPERALTTAPKAPANPGQTSTPVLVQSAAQAAAEAVKETAAPNGLPAADDTSRTATVETRAAPRLPDQASPVAQAARSKDLPFLVARHAADDRAAAQPKEPVARAAEIAAPPPPPVAQIGAAQTSAQAQLAVLQPMTREAMAAKEKSEAALSLDGEAESLRFDLRGSTGSTGTQPGATVAGMSRPDAARGVAMQIAEMMRGMPDRPVDISLSPEELGRVRLSVSAGEGGVTLHVLAERPETLDLMRRHADMLARELADLGFTSIDLAFGQGKDPGNGEADADGTKGGPAATDTDGDPAAPEDGPTRRVMLGSSGGLDIRI